MIEYSYDWKYNAQLLMRNLTPQTNISIITEEKEICQLLKPIKDKINEIILLKGSISLISSILELFYDKKRKILSVEDILEGIKNKIENNVLTIFENPIFFYLDSTNFKEKVNKILNNDDYFEILFVDDKEYIQIKTEYIKNNLTNIISQLFEQYNIL